MMKNILIGVVVLIVILVGGFYALNAYIYEQKQAVAVSDYKNVEFSIGGERIQLEEGVAEKESAPGSASKIVTHYFGNVVMQDLNNDGREDAVFLVTQETGGSGTFFYVVAALNTERGYVGSEALLLGDRIAPQTTEKGPLGSVIVNYADRKPGEDFSVQPSLGKSIRLKLDVDSMQFGEVAQNFEGEADPKKMSLGMKTWTWMSSSYNDGSEVIPKKSDSFILTLGNNGKFTATTDCNQMGGSYASTGETISFSGIYATKMYCAGSEEGEFSKMLETVSGYHFTSQGQMVLDLKFDSGSAVFR